MEIIALLDARDITFDKVERVPLDGTIEIHFYNDQALTFELLHTIATALGTRLIDVKSDYERSYYDAVHSRLVLEVRWPEGHALACNPPVTSTDPGDA